MRKVILLLSVIGVTLLMTSCLGDVTNNYKEISFVYLDTDDRGNPYGKTFSRRFPSRFITDNKMMTMEPGTIQYMHYEWQEEKGSSEISVGGQAWRADNVDILDRQDIQHTYLNLSALPGGEEDEEDIEGFDEIVAPFYVHSREFIGDHWVFEYAYTTTEAGKSPRVEFYKRDGVNERGEIVIDVRLSFVEDSKVTTTGQHGNAVALNMSPLRNASAEDELKIKFKYNRKSGGSSNLVVTDLPSQQAYEWKLVDEEE